jgi:hypothetical protein
MAIGFMVVLFFVSASVYAEYKDMGPGEVFGIKVDFHGSITNESWISNDGASSLMQYGWQFYNRDSAMVMINMLSNIILKEKSLYYVGKYENKNDIRRRPEYPFELFVQLFDNGIIRILIIDRNTGRQEYWYYK